MMAWTFSSRQSTAALIAVEDDEDSAKLPTVRYCVGTCTCGNDCHNNPDYHLTFTTWDGEYPQLQEDADADEYNLALSTLMGGG